MAGGGAGQRSTAGCSSSGSGSQPPAKVRASPLTVGVLKIVHPQLLHGPLLLPPLLLPARCDPWLLLLGRRVPGCRCGGRVPRRLLVAATAAKTRICTGHLAVLPSTCCSCCCCCRVVGAHPADAGGHNLEGGARRPCGAVLPLVHLQPALQQQHKGEREAGARGCRSERAPPWRMGSYRNAANGCPGAAASTKARRQDAQQWHRRSARCCAAQLWPAAHLHCHAVSLVQLLICALSQRTPHLNIDPVAGTVAGRQAGAAGQVKQGGGEMHG